jgi:hypothetical protein
MHTYGALFWWFILVYFGALVVFLLYLLYFGALMVG